VRPSRIHARMPVDEIAHPPDVVPPTIAVPRVELDRT
jgi:hypothetical protein